MVSRDNRHRVGQLGEGVARRYLEKHGYTVVGTNVRNKAGELDIVTQKESTLVFIEVKTVRAQLPDMHINQFDPRENLHKHKIAKLEKTIKVYLFEHHVEGDWRLDGMVVYLDTLSRKAQVEHIPHMAVS